MPQIGSTTTIVCVCVSVRVCVYMCVVSLYLCVQLLQLFPLTPLVSVTLDAGCHFFFYFFSIFFPANFCTLLSPRTRARTHTHTHIHLTAVGAITLKGFASVTTHTHSLDSTHTHSLDSRCQHTSAYILTADVC